MLKRQEMQQESWKLTTLKPSNRLATTSLDGFVRLYDFDDKASLHLVAKSRVSGRKSITIWQERHRFI